MAVSHYSKSMVLLHWLIALMLLVSLSAGMVVLANLAPDDPEKLSMLGAHAISGLSIALLMLIRMVIRLRSELPPSVNAAGSIAEKVEKVTHWSFYALVLLMAVTGVATLVVSGTASVLQAGSGVLPALDGYPTMLGHEWMSKLLMVLIVLHIAAAVKHRVVRGESLMKRMSLKKAK